MATVLVIEFVSQLLLMNFPPVTLDIAICIAQVFLFLVTTFVAKLLIDNTLQRLSQWFSPEAEFNPFELARQLLDKCIRSIQGFGALGIVLVNGYLAYREDSIYQVVRRLISEVPAQQWQMLAIGFLKSILLLTLITLVIASLPPWLKSLGDRLKAWESVKLADDSIDKLLKAVELGLGTGLWLVALSLCLNFLFVPAAMMAYFYLVVEWYLFICLGIIIARLVFTAVDALDGLADAYITKHPKSLIRFYPRFRYLKGFTKRCLEYAIYVSIAGVIINQISLLKAIAPYTITVNQIITIILGTAICIEIANIIIESLLLRNQNLDPFERRRRLTFVPLLQNTVRYGIYFGAGVAVLYVINIDPTPILAGAGILGIAVGLGAQNLINDLVNGFTILLQNYYLVGDFVETDNATGIVEAMDLRVTRIRSTSGRLHIVRNGDITTIVNYSKDYVYAVVFVGVDYESNLDHVYEVLNAVGQEIKEIHPDVLEPTRIDGLDNFSESELTIRTSTKVKPGKHLPVERLIRKLIKEAFDRENVEIPFARRVLIFKNGDGEEIKNISQTQEGLASSDGD